MSLSIFSPNALEAGLVTSPRVGGLTRLYDRDRGPQYQIEPVSGLVDAFPLTLTLSPSSVSVDIDVDLLVATPVTGWALLNTNVTGAPVVLKGDTTSPATTSRDSVDPLAADVFRTFAALTFRYWRLTIPAMSTTAKIGEFMLGVPRVIGQNPTLPTGLEQPLGNIATDLSPAGYAWSKLLGAKRMRYRVAWAAMPYATDYLTLLAAFDDCAQGGKNVALKLPNGTVRWARWVELGEPSSPEGLAAGVNVSATFEEAL